MFNVSDKGIDFTGNGFWSPYRNKMFETRKKLLSISAEIYDSNIANRLERNASFNA